MNYKTLEKKYLVFLSTLARVNLTNTITYESLGNFPNKLNTSLIKEWNVLGKAIKALREGNNSLIKKIKFPGYVYLFHIMRPVVVSKMEKRDGGDIFDFSDIVIEQLIVLTHSYLEAFLSDVFRIIYQKDNNLLNSEYQLTWNDLKKEKSIKSLKNQLIDRVIAKSNFNRIDEIIPKLRKEPFNVADLKIDHDHLRLLKELRLIRNCIIHNGSELSSEYKEFKQIDQKHDCIIHSHLNQELINQQYNLARYVASEIFISVSVKYFGKSNKKLRKSHHVRINPSSLKGSKKE